MATRKKKSYHHGDLRRAVLDAAFALVAKRGIGSLSLREAARIARVSHMAPYAHFKDKDDLVAAMKEESFRELGAALRTASSNAGAATAAAPGSVLRALGATYVRFALEQPAKFQIMFRNPFVPGKRKAQHRFIEAGQEIFALLEEAFRKASPQGETASPLLAWAMVHGLLSLRIDGPLVHIVPGTDADKGFEALVQEATDRLLGLLGIR